MAEDPFLTLAGPGRSAMKERGSTFLGFADPVGSEGEVRTQLEALTAEHHDASHHCFAWRLRDGSFRANDAGEPSQSAGAPILQAIEAAGLTDTLVVVVRWFGGTKLGVGGLVRAYGGAAEAALRAAPLHRGIPAQRFRIRYPYELTGELMRATEAAGAVDISHGYADGGREGELTLTVPNSGVETFRTAVREATADRVRPTSLGGCTLYREVGGGAAS